jgi:uncharacterized protein YndB with AHSA1/START domain
MNAAAGVRGDRVSVGVFVDAEPAIAFEVFTDQIDQWWRHGLKFRVGARGVSVLHLEPRLGGRLFETLSPDDDGASSPAVPRSHVVQTGTVTGWDPPHAMQIEWRGVNFAAHEKTLVSVKFEQRAGGTQVTLVHSGFASLPADHPVRHGQAVDAFVRHMALWWSDQMSSLRARVAARPSTDATPAPGARG